MWHGYADGWEAWVSLTCTDRWLCVSELDALIERANEEGAGTGRPKDDR